MQTVESLGAQGNALIKSSQADRKHIIELYKEIQRLEATAEKKTIALVEKLEKIAEVFNAKIAAAGQHWNENSPDELDTDDNPFYNMKELTLTEDDNSVPYLEWSEQ